MSTQLPVQCVNCGTALELPESGATGVRCPVCQLVNEVGDAPRGQPLTRDSLEHRLGDLITQARAGGLASEEILGALRDELEFAAELAHFGRQMHVQIIDLGPQERQDARRPPRDRAAVLRGRAVGE